MMHTWFSCTFLVSLGKKTFSCTGDFLYLSGMKQKCQLLTKMLLVKRQKADASSFNHKKCLIPNLSFDLVNIWPKAVDAMGLTEKQVIWGS